MFTVQKCTSKNLYQACNSKTYNDKQTFKSTNEGFGSTLKGSSGLDEFKKSTGESSSLIDTKGSSDTEGDDKTVMSEGKSGKSKGKGHKHAHRHGHKHGKKSDSSDENGNKTGQGNPFSGTELGSDETSGSNNGSGESGNDNEVGSSAGVNNTAGTADTNELSGQNGSSTPSKSGVEELDRWDAQIEAAAKSTGLPANFIKATLWAESRGNPNDPSQNPDGEHQDLGVMQISDYTYSDVLSSQPNAPQGLKASNQSDNIMMGAWELKDKLEKAGGDFKKTSQAYVGTGESSDATYADWVNTYWNELNNGQKLSDF